MTDRWETRKAEAERRVRLAVEAYGRERAEYPPLPDKTWGPLGESRLVVTQPLDPEVFGLGVLYAIVADEEPLRYIIVRFRDGSSDFFSVEALEIETHERSSFFGHWHDFYSTTVRVPLPADLSSFQKEGGAEVSMTGGGTTDPHKVSIAARVLGIAAFLAEHLDDQMKATKVKAKLVPDEPPVITPERFHTLAMGKWVVAEMQPKNGRKRTVRGDIHSIEYHRGSGVFQSPQPGDIVRAIYIEDKAARLHVVDIPLVQRLITGGENGITLVVDGELAPDYRLAR